MSSGIAGGSPGQVVWTEDVWLALIEESGAAVARTRNTDAAFAAVAPYASRIMRAYSSSFFVVTRFLPARKRRLAEIIYANVRYPDEVVDTFPLESEARLARLARWEADYEQALDASTPAAAVGAGAPAFLACFASMVREHNIPHEHYRSFLQAMRADVRPRLYATMPDLVDSYVYGSAIVVGYLLTYAFGVATPALRDRAFAAARDLGVGLQMTNFLRDVLEDAARGRMYLPEDRWSQAGLSLPIGSDPDELRAWGRLVARMAEENDALYASALTGLSAFASDAQPAIGACIRVYRMLNDRLASFDMSPTTRAGVPSWQKFRALPSSKYWVLPGAFLVRR